MIYLNENWEGITDAKDIFNLILRNQNDIIIKLNDLEHTELSNLKTSVIPNLNLQIAALQTEISILKVELENVRAI